MEWTRANWRLALAVLIVSLVSSVSRAGSTSLECPIESSSGQPACGSSVDVGSNAPDESRSQHVGNPIDVVSGNKYQNETDIQLGGSRLSLVRHYNSSQAAVNLGLGNGWRHTYSVVLSADGEDVRRIHQSDGRLIEFHRQGEQFRSSTDSDGYVIESSNNRFYWYVPDGRRFSFHGSFLTGISFADGEHLSLMYRAMRLHSVTDDLGRSLIFHYTQGEKGLPSYDSSPNGSASGHLERVSLPGGESVRYRYSRDQNLVSVIYPLGIQRHSERRYQYRDRQNRALLTERVNGAGRILARWSYDDLGRAVSYNRGGNIRSDGSDRNPVTLELHYSSDGEEDSGTTRVTFGNGGEQSYRWQLNAAGQVSVVERLDTSAESTAQTGRDSAADTVIRRESVPGTQRYPHDVLTVLSLDAMGYPASIEYMQERDASTHVLASEYDQTGRLVEVEWLSGSIEGFNDNQPSTRDDVMRHVQQSKVTGENRKSAVEALVGIGLIEGMAAEFLKATNKELSVGTSITGQELDEAWWSGAMGLDASGSARTMKTSDETGDEVPCVDPLKDCESLLRTRDYAEVAECAYVDADCSTRFVEADLESLNLQIEDLHEGSFHAEIFYDSDNDEYIVTFAGTDFTSPGDWISNIEQELGLSAFQYEKAVELATKLQTFNDGRNITYTGHSLGGGLATTAAAVSGANANVFNPAALDPDSASDLSIDIEVARENTQIYSVRGELLSEFQTGVGFANEAVGNLNVLPRPNFGWVQDHMSDSSMLTYSQRLSLALHGMDAVNQSIADLIELNRCT